MYLYTTQYPCELKTLSVYCVLCAGIVILQPRRQFIFSVNCIETENSGKFNILCKLGQLEQAQAGMGRGGEIPSLVFMFNGDTF